MRIQEGNGKSGINKSSIKPGEHMWIKLCISKQFYLNNSINRLFR